MEVRSFLLTAVMAAAATAASAEVDCDTPDDLCVGDPCLIGSLRVTDPCIVDFGARTVVQTGTLRLPTNGTLSLRAGAMELRGTVTNARDVGNAGGSGPTVSLTTTADLDLRGRVRLNGRLAGGGQFPGALVLDAGGDLTVRRGVRVTTGPTSMALEAGGSVDLGGRLATSSPGGTATITAGGDVEVSGGFRRLDAVDIDAGGDVLLDGRAVILPSLTIDAGGLVTVARPLRLPEAQVTLRGATGVRVERPVGLLRLFENGGSLVVTSTGGSVVIDAPVRAYEVSVEAAGDVLVNALVTASPPARSAGIISLVSTGGNVAVAADLKAQSGDGVRPLDGRGGDVIVSAAAAARVAGDVRVNAFPGRTGPPGGTIEIEGATVEVGPGVVLDANGSDPAPQFADRPPSGFRFTATSGEVVLAGTFEARGGPSRVQAVAATNLTATGTFDAAPDGCITLTAGGSLDATGASFDPPPASSCP